MTLYNFGKSNDIYYELRRDTMKEPLDLSKYSIRTDLAVEAHQMLQESQEEQKGYRELL